MKMKWNILNLTLLSSLSLCSSLLCLDCSPSFQDADSLADRMAKKGPEYKGRGF